MPNFKDQILKIFIFYETIQVKSEHNISNRQFGLGQEWAQEKKSIV